MMATRLNIWEPCIDCASRKLEEQHGIGYDQFDSPCNEHFDQCVHAPICKYIDGLPMLGKERDA